MKHRLVSLRSGAINFCDRQDRSDIISMNLITDQLVVIARVRSGYENDWARASASGMSWV